MSGHVWPSAFVGEQGPEFPPGSIRTWDGPVIAVADPRWWGLTIAKRDELTHWLDANEAYQPSHITGIEYDVVDCPLIRVTRLVCDRPDEHHPIDGPPGHGVVLDPDSGRPPKVLARTDDYLIRTPIPEWWTP